MWVAEILRWADAYRAATGRWPSRSSGWVRKRSWFLTWHTVDVALAAGTHGLPGGQSLVQLLREHRGIDPATGRRLADAHGRPFPLRSISGQILTLSEILTWADEYRAATGRWPSISSGEIPAAPGESWASVDALLLRGGCGVPVGTTLRQLLDAYWEDRLLVEPSDLNLEQILAWADAYHDVHGNWPIPNAGPIPWAPRTTWRGIDNCLKQGSRGLPGGSSLLRLLEEHRGRQRPGAKPRLTVEQILAWADAYHELHGRWPGRDSGTVPGVSGDTWWKINVALADGYRGLPGGTTLGRLLAKHRGARRKNAAAAPDGDHLETPVGADSGNDVRNPDVLLDPAGAGGAER
jgi:hypothetical protein